MLQFYQKRSLLSWCRSPLVLLVLAGLCTWLAISVYERYSIEREMAERRLAAEADVAAMQARKEALAERVQYLSHERGIEAEMRRNFDIAKPGEEVVIILDDDTAAADIRPLSEPAPERPWYQFWWVSADSMIY